MMERRAFLSAAMLAPVTACVSGPAYAATFPAADLGEWAMAKEAYCSARVAMDRDQTDAAGAAFVDAEERLIRTPAPDLHALRDKMEAIACIGEEGLIGSAQFAPLMSDISRLVR